MKIPTREELAALSGRISIEEGERLMFLSSQLHLGAKVVEIGSYRGKSTCYIATGLRLSNNTSGKVHAVDVWTKGATNSAKYHTQDTYDIFKKQVSELELDDLITPHMNTSLDAAKKHTRPIDMLFLDGNHKYKSIHEDWEAWKVFLKEGSTIAFHDHAEKYPGVMQVVDEEVMPNYKLMDIHQIGRLWSATFYGPRGK